MTGYFTGLARRKSDFSSYFQAATLHYINVVKPDSDDFVIVLIGMMAAFFLLFGLCYSIPTFLCLLLQGILLGLHAGWVVYFPAIFSLIVLAGSSFDITVGILFRLRFNLSYDLSRIALRPVAVTVFAILCYPINYVWIKLLKADYLSVGIAIVCWGAYALRGRKLINHVKKSSYDR